MEWTQRHTEGETLVQQGDQTRPDTHPSTPGTGQLHRSKCTQAILSVCLSPALSMMPQSVHCPFCIKINLRTKPFLPILNTETPLLKCNCGLCTVGEAGERKEHQPALTLTTESKAGPASTPVSPWVPSQMGLAVILHKRNR